MIAILLTIFTIHFIGDFALQSRKMGLNKGKSLFWLTMHVGVYLSMLLFSGLFFGHLFLGYQDLFVIFLYCILNAAIHWVTDFVTSKASGFSYVKMLEYEAKGDEKKKHFWQYWFWFVIGFDQLLHIVALSLTYQYFFI